MIDGADEASPNEWPRTRSIVSLYWQHRKKQKPSRNGASKPIPMPQRNKMINKLNERKARIMRTFPDGKYARWAVKELANIQRQLEKL